MSQAYEGDRVKVNGEQQDALCIVSHSHRFAQLDGFLVLGEESGGHSCKSYYSYTYQQYAPSKKTERLQTRLPHVGVTPPFGLRTELLRQHSSGLFCLRQVARVQAQLLGVLWR